MTDNAEWFSWGRMTVWCIVRSVQGRRLAEWRGMGIKFGGRRGWGLLRGFLHGVCRIG